MIEPGYPVTMVHPHHKAASIRDKGDFRPADPEKFPAVSVNGTQQEAQCRAQGYLRYGEPIPVRDFHEYPKILRHPEYKEAIPARTDAKIENDRIVGTFTIPSVPAYMPDVTVTSLEEEELYRAKDYKPAGEYNQAALSSVLDGTVYEEEYVAKQYPMWVDDTDAEPLADGTFPKKLIKQDPNEPPELVPTPEYPRYENGIVVPDPRFPVEPDPHLYPMWVHKNGIPSEESELADGPKKEFEIRRKWDPNYGKETKTTTKPKEPAFEDKDQFENIEAVASSSKKPRVTSAPL